MNTTHTLPLSSPASRLRHFPISFFSVVMGLAGFSIAWARAESVLQLPISVSAALAWLAAAMFAFFTGVYALKATLYGAAVVQEFRHPVRINFFPAFSISLLLLSIAFLQRAPVAAALMWMLGTLVHLSFTLIVMNRWIHHPGVEVAHVNPSWFIPVVGNILVPVTGVTLWPPDVSWFFFSIGLVFWLVLLTIVLYRLFFHAPLPERMTPTLFIMVAPPAVGCIAYVALVGQVDAFAHVLYSTALFFTLLLATNAMRFLRTRFFLSAWAYSFPLAAMTIATLMMAHHTGRFGYGVIATALLTVLTLVVAALVVRTLVAVARAEICVEEH